MRRKETRERQRPPSFGIAESFVPGDREYVEAILHDMAALGVSSLRTRLSWADAQTPEGRGWHEWLLPRLAEKVDVLPCLVETPPALGIEPKRSAPPRRPEAFGDFVDEMVERFGSCFQHVELWDQPNDASHWDSLLDPDWALFAETMKQGALAAHRRGKRVVLAGMRPTDLLRLQRLADLDVLRHMDVVGVHGYPGTWEFNWEGWPQLLQRVRDLLNRSGSVARLWVTAAGYSTWRHDQYEQLRALVRLMDAPVERAYWHAMRDVDPARPERNGRHRDERRYHLGLRYADGIPKLACRLWANAGADTLHDLADFDRYFSGNGVGRPVRSRSLKARRLHARGSRRPRPILITGGAGFVGTNVAERLLTTGRPVLILDNLSRPGVEENLRWLCRRYGDAVEVELADVRDAEVVQEAVRNADGIFHFAAQVAVTTALEDPVTDFNCNATGTMNLLEALRSLDNPPPLLFTSTNKVYGNLGDVPLRETDTHYEPDNTAVREHGISETRSLDFHCPYGCSKGAADQYVLDYARNYDLPTVVFRMSCIYGTHQWGTEDQGWVAHFLIQALNHRPITIYGDGKQVRDVLFVDDLVDAMMTVVDGIDALKGRAFNIGGGPRNAISLRELISMIETMNGSGPEVRYGPWRQGDQRYYVSDVRAFGEATGWRPRTGVHEGVQRLNRWLKENRETAEDASSRLKETVQ